MIFCKPNADFCASRQIIWPFAFIDFLDQIFKTTYRQPTFVSDVADIASDTIFTDNSLGDGQSKLPG
jgi:hypothetical protein